MSPLYVIVDNKLIKIAQYSIAAGVVSDISARRKYMLHECYEDLAEVCSDLLLRVADLESALDSRTETTNEDFYQLNQRLCALEALL